MAKQKIKRKELLKSPDEFLTFSERAINYIRDRAKYFEYAGMAVAAAALVYLAVTTYLGHVNRKGQAAYNEAYSETAQGKTDIEKAQSLFRKVTEEYGLSKASRLVPPQLGYLDYQRKQYGEAVKHYETFVKGLPGDSPYRFLSKLALAAVHEEKGEPDEAIEILNDLKSDTENVFMEQTFLSLARLYRVSKQDEKAGEVYAEFVDRFKASPFLPMAKAYLNEHPS